MPPAEQMYAELLQVRAELAALRQENKWLKGQLFGPGKGEKLDRLQGQLALGETPTKEVAKVQEVKYERVVREKRPVSAEVFKDLPVVETVTIEPEEVKAAPELWERIGEEKTFEVDVISPKLVKREIIRPKYRHRLDRSLAPVVAEAPARAVMGGYASAGLLAWIALSKYVDHQPLYRLEKQSERWGARIPRQSMADWVRMSAEWLEPIYRRMSDRLLSGDYLQVDETPVRCSDPDEKNGGTTEGWLWVMSRPGEDVVFDWRLSRRHGELTQLIEGFKGYLQSDGYAAYEAYAKEHPEVTWVACWAHARRKFYEAHAEWPKAVDLILRMIGWIYECEALWDEHKMKAADRLRHRRKNLRPFYWLKRIVRGIRERVLPKSGLGKACDYLLRFWDPLMRHFETGLTRIDNNLVENAIRPSAIGKKNWLFIGHPNAGQRSAILYSVVVSCQRRGIDPYQYLRDVLTRLPRMSNQDDLDALTPARWQPAS